VFRRAARGDSKVGGTKPETNKNQEHSPKGHRERVGRGEALAGLDGAKRSRKRLSSRCSTTLEFASALSGLVGGLEKYQSTISMLMSAGHRLRSRAPVKRLRLRTISCNALPQGIGPGKAHPDGRPTGREPATGISRGEKPAGLRGPAPTARPSASSSRCCVSAPTSSRTTRLESGSGTRRLAPILQRAPNPPRAAHGAARPASLPGAYNAMTLHT
jgi:hypothetical protein